jgi:hypothetical protein
MALSFAADICLLSGMDFIGCEEKSGSRFRANAHSCDEAA